MSAPNFYSKAGTVYAIEITEDDDYIVEDTQCNVVTELSNNPALALCPTDEHDNDSRSYPGHVFATVTPRKSRDDLWPEAKLICRSGYYANANLDYAIEIYDSYSGSYCTLDELHDDDIKFSVEECIGRKVYAREVTRIRKRLEREAAKIEA
jgi:hypothetical protein